MQATVLHQTRTCWLSKRGSILGGQIQRWVLNSQLRFSRTGGCPEWWRCWRRRLLQATASSNARFAPFDAGVFAFHSIHYLTSTVFKHVVVVCNAFSNPAQVEWSERNRSCLLASSHWPKTPKTQRFPAMPPFPENFPSPPASGCRRVSFISVANLYALSRGGSQTVPRGRFDRGGAEFKDMIRACPGFWQFVLRCFTASVQDEKVQLRKKIQYQIAIAEVVVCSYLHMSRKETCFKKKTSPHPHSSGIPCIGLGLQHAADGGEHTPASSLVDQMWKRGQELIGWKWSPSLRWLLLWLGVVDGADHVAQYMPALYTTLLLQ